MLEGSEETQARNQTQLMSWSRRLDLALGMLAAHLTTGDDQDVGQPCLARRTHLASGRPFCDRLDGPRLRGPN